MRKNIGVKPYLLPMPVLVIGTYNEDKSPNAMNVAYGSMRDDKSLSLYINPVRKTIKNILRTKAFTVNLADMEHLLDADYIGIVSGNENKDKLKRTSFEAIKSEFVDAPIISFSPLSIECKFVSYDEKDHRLVGEIVNVCVEEEFIDQDGKIKTESMDLITYNPIENTYNLLGGFVGNAFASKEIMEDENLDMEAEEYSEEYLKKDLDKRIKRITKMEKIMEELSQVQEKLNEALDEFENFKEKAKAFDDYYSSEKWMEDYSADDMGLLPEDMERGVLNEDIPYDVLGENYNLAMRMKDLSRKIINERN